MSAKFDVAKINLRSFSKGEIVSIAPEGMDCSDDTVNFICVEITNVTREEAHDYVNEWKIDFDYNQLSQNAQRWIYEVTVDPVYISATETGKAQIKQEMRDHIESGSEYWEGCTVLDFTAESITVRIPKNGVYQTAEGLSDVEYLRILKLDFSDIFKTVFAIRRYYFTEAYVDQVVAAGNYVAITKSESLSIIQDRLDD